MRLLSRLKPLCDRQGVGSCRLTTHHIVPLGLSQNKPHTHKCLAKFRQSDTPTAPHMLLSTRSITRPPTAHPSPLHHPSTSVHFHTSSPLVRISNGSIEKNACLGRKVKVRTISSSISEPITLTFLLFPDTKQSSPRGLTPPAQNAEKAILVQLPLPVRSQGRKQSSLFSMITHSRRSRYDLTF